MARFLSAYSVFGLLLVASLQPRPAKAQGADFLAKRAHVASATVTLPERSCAGSIVGSATQVLTAAHCIPSGREEVAVLVGKRRMLAVVALMDRTRDTALLALSEAVPIEPLELETQLPEPGDRVLFVGRTDRPIRAQLARVTHLGSCPSLPGVSDALFTSIRARPGDSGSPIVNDSSRVVGVIHGGAACHIAAPTVHLARELSDGEPDPGPEPAAIEASAKGYSIGPFRFERSRADGVLRYRFEMRLGRIRE